MPAPGKTLRTNLGRRIVFLVGQSMLLMLIVLGLSSWFAVRESTSRVLQERHAVAQATGTYLNAVLSQNLERLDAFRLAPDINLEDNTLDPEKRTLHSIYLGSVFDSVFLTDQTGKLLWIEPSRPDVIGAGWSVYPVVSASIEGRKPLVSDVFTESNGKQVVMMVDPVHNAAGQIVGVVGGVITPAVQGLYEFTRTVNLGASSFVDIVDSNGVVLSSSDARRVLNPESVNSQDEVTELAPLSVAPWSVAVRQSVVEAMAPVNTLTQRFVIFGAGAFVLALLLSVSMARSLLRPLGRLSAAAKVISRGDLSTPVPQMGNDEIGDLSLSFDSMRVELKSSLEKIQGWNRELEAKVNDRTRQLKVSYEEIERSEVARGELLRKTLTVQEDERKRIARELHDETIQSLVALLMRLDTTAALPEETPEKRKERLEAIRALAVKTIDTVHKMIFDLRPSVLDDLGLLSAIRWYADHRLADIGVKARVEVTGEERKLPPQIEIAVFRVAQEAITNIMRHAEAKNVVISVEFNHTLNMEIEDDGKGFDVGSVAVQPDKGQGLGLMGMKERVTLLGGTFEIDSQPGDGTRLAIRIPIT